LVLISTRSLWPVLGAGYLLGYRLSVQTGSVPVPTAAASPDEVVRSYVEAYNRRDFAEVTLDCSGLTGSDLAYDEGPNRWTYWLERSSVSERWTITDHGNG
jgi:hypothetical protein